MEPTLFDVGRAQLPPRVLAFASGVNEAREIRGFSLARIPVGFSAGHVREEAKEELLRSDLPLFADSGAFSEVAVTPDGLRVVYPISHQQWIDRLSLYQCLAERHGNKLSLVVPDRVGDQDYTLGLLMQYGAQLRRLAATGARLLVPLQRGALTRKAFYVQACELVGVSLNPALPMKKAGMTHAQVLEFVAEVRPAHVHLLGLGYQRARTKQLVRRLLARSGEITVSLDSNRLRAVVGKTRPLTTAEGAMHKTEASRMFAEVDHPTLYGAEETLDYTEAINHPSIWAGRSELKRVAAEGIAAEADRCRFVSDPDAYLQTEVDGQPLWLCPFLSLALDRAWCRYVGARVHVAVRTAAIRTTFSDAQIASSAASSRD